MSSINIINQENSLTINSIASPADQQQALLNARLIVACDQGKLSIAQDLIKQGADVHARDRNGFSSILRASQKGDLLVIDLLLRNGANIEDTLKGYTPLMRVCCTGNIQCAQMLLRKGAKIEERSERGHTPLLISTVSGDTTMVQLLLGKGAQVNAQSNQGLRALMHAAYMQHFGIARQLMTSGAHVNAADNNGNTALHHAYTGNPNPDEKLLRLLIKNGGDIFATNKTGRAPGSRTTLPSPSLRELAERVQIEREIGQNALFHQSERM